MPPPTALPCAACTAKTQQLAQAILTAVLRRLPPAHVPGLLEEIELICEQYAGASFAPRLLFEDVESR